MYLIEFGHQTIAIEHLEHHLDICFICRYFAIVLSQ